MASRGQKRAFGEDVTLLGDDVPLMEEDGSDQEAPQGREGKARKVIYVPDSDEEDGGTADKTVEDLADKILSVFPDVEFNYLLGLVRKLKSQAAVFDYLLDHPAYPKSKTDGTEASAQLTGVPSSGSSRPASHSASRSHRATGSTTTTTTGMTVERMQRYVELLNKAEQYTEAAAATAKGERPKPSKLYSKHAVAHLRNTFPEFRSTVIKEVYNTQGPYFFTTKQYMKRLLKGYQALKESNKSDEAMVDDEALKSVGLSHEDMVEAAAWLATKRKKERPASPLPDMKDREFEAELAFSRDYDTMQEEKDERDRREMLANELAAKAGTVIQCGCCFDSFAFENLVQCTEGHLFCRSCLRSFAHARVFGENRTKLTCMSMSEQCSGSFSDSQLLRVLEPKAYIKYQERATDEAIKLAKVDGLVTCHNCGFRAQVEAAGDSDGDRVLTCPVESCRMQTCVLCMKDAHPGATCEEARKTTHLRTTVEEAMTDAKVRICPTVGCKTPYVKQPGGCNKVICTSCNAASCYICRKAITSYTHFCRTPFCTHGSCGVCPLFTDDAKDDEKAMKQAAQRAKQQLEGGGGGETVKVPPKDVEDDKSDSAPWFSGQHVSTALGGLMGGINTGLNRINTFVSHLGARLSPNPPGPPQRPGPAPRNRRRRHHRI